MRLRILAAALAGFLAAAPLTATAQIQPIYTSQVWLPQSKLATPISVTTSSAATLLPVITGQALPGNIGWFCNTGSNDAYLAFGTANTVAATVAAGSWLKAATCAAYPLNPRPGLTYTYVAAIGAGATTIAVETGLGTPPLSIASSGGGGGGGGAVTIASGAVASGAYSSGSIASGAFASGSIASGAMVDLLTMRGTKAPGTAAANSLLIGGVYNAAGVSLTDTQQAALQLTAQGYLQVSSVGVGLNQTIVGVTGSAVVGKSTTAPASCTDSQTCPLNLTAGSLSNLRTDLASVNGNTALAGNGSTGNGSPRVTISDDNSPLAIAGRNNVTPTDCSGTITTGGTAQNAHTAQAALRGSMIANLSTTEVMWISFTATAAPDTAGSYPLAPATATTLAGLSSFTTPLGMGYNTALSVVAATTGHKFSCTRW